MRGPWVGEKICNCVYDHVRITSVSGDDVTLEGYGSEVFSYEDCCHPANHDWEHPEVFMRDGKHEVSL